MLSKRMPFEKAVILGAAGFIGVNLSHALIKLGYDVICFDRIESPEWPRDVQSVVGEFDSMPIELISKLDHAVVFHLISSCRPAANTVQAASEVENDLITTIRYLEICRGRTLRWVFVSSGGTIYGNSGAAQISEEAPTLPICSYGLVKLAIEQYFALYRRIHGTDYIVVRLANPYGPLQRPLTGQGIIATLIYKSQLGEPIEVWGDGENVRDYIYIEDAVSGLLAAAAAEGGDVYNVGTGVDTSIKQLINIISDTLGVQIPVLMKESRTVDVRRNVLDASKLSRIANWRPQTDLKSGINKTTLWMKKHTHKRIL